MGGLRAAEVECGPVAAPVPCVVVNVDYRLAPEHRRHAELTGARVATTPLPPPPSQPRRAVRRVGADGTFAVVAPTSAPASHTRQDRHRRHRAEDGAQPDDPAAIRTPAPGRL
ncbi:MULTISPECIES: alpha/beta hydrolase fold domain-containing protein [Streptomycetaceae]|uniref:alpha/beta hydrolase fold domain-containing protein n=1 Tax=Embleya scabrispora TaxID=159449 RepID=UPI00037DB898|nr:alpha/beta hydrolase fold domain-containing protein [Streptomyces sp. SID5474]